MFVKGVLYIIEGNLEHDLLAVWFVLELDETVLLEFAQTVAHELFGVADLQTVADPSHFWL